MTMEKYTESLLTFLKVEEGERKTENDEHIVYDDPEKNKTIGTGFKLTNSNGVIDPVAQKYWDKYGPELNLPSINDLLNKYATLNNKQAYGLTRLVLDDKRIELENYFGETWNGLSDNIKFAIEDSYFNGAGKLVKVVLLTGLVFLINKLFSVIPLMIPMTIK